MVRASQADERAAQEPLHDEIVRLQVRACRCAFPYVVICRYAFPCAGLCLPECTRARGYPNARGAGAHREVAT